MEGRCTLVAEGRLHGASRRARVWPVPHIWCTSSAVHLVEGARCGSAPCVARRVAGAEEVEVGLVLVGVEELACGWGWG